MSKEVTYSAKPHYRSVSYIDQSVTSGSTLRNVKLTKREILKLFRQEPDWLGQVRLRRVRNYKVWGVSDVEIYDFDYNNLKELFPEFWKLPIKD